jgi:hypothetical protein
MQEACQLEKVLMFQCAAQSMHEMHRKSRRQLAENPNSSARGSVAAVGVKHLSRHVARILAREEQE